MLDTLEDEDNEKHAIQTMHRGKQVSRKLKRRLTLRTIAEAKALKKQSTQAINILVYAAELVKTGYFFICFWLKNMGFIVVFIYRLSLIRNKR